MCRNPQFATGASALLVSRFLALGHFLISHCYCLFGMRRDEGFNSDRPRMSGDEFGEADEVDVWPNLLYMPRFLRISGCDESAVLDRSG
jgi:hypothetical protein